MLPPLAPKPTPTPSHHIESLTKSKATRAKRRSNPKHAKSNDLRSPITNVCNLTTSCKCTMWGTIRVTDHHPSANRHWSRRRASQSNTPSFLLLRRFLVTIKPQGLDILVLLVFPSYDGARSAASFNWRRPDARADADALFWATPSPTRST